MKHCKVEEHAWVIVTASLHFFRRNFLDLLLRLTPSFEVDPLLKRTFLYAIPVGELDKIVGSKEFDVCDVCVALVAFCSCNVVPASKVSDLHIGDNVWINTALHRHSKSVVFRRLFLDWDGSPLDGSLVSKTYESHSLGKIADPSGMLDACVNPVMTWLVIEFFEAQR